MKKKAKIQNRGLKTIIVFTLFVLFVLFICVSALMYELTKKPYIKKNVDQKNESYLFEYYFTTNPDIMGRDFIGSPDARVTVIIFTDFISDAGKDFEKDIVPQLRDEFIDSGRVRLYYKTYISDDDYNSKENGYVYATAILCIEESIGKGNLSDIIDAIVGLETDKIDNVAERFGIAKSKFNKCMDSSDYIIVQKDMIDSEKLAVGTSLPAIYIGIDGKDNTKIVGVPSYARLRRAIRNKEVILGI
ncbi:MAG: DsbA family protein [Nanoarchaeota archaeon]|nr:DsbA family protein [Nanoarchaeota archaeon]